jgi:hypothetical protein
MAKTIKPKSTTGENKAIEDVDFEETKTPSVKPDSIDKAVVISHPELNTEDKKPKGDTERKEQINIDGKDAKVQGSQTINFGDSKSINDFVEEPSTQHTDTEEKKTQTTAKSEVDEIKAFEENTKLGVDDFVDLSEAAIDIIEGFISSGLRWYAKDTTDEPYSLSVKKKTRLKNQLSILLLKYRVKFKIEYIFFLTLIVVFATPVKNAFVHRKKVIKGYIYKPTK